MSAVDDYLATLDAPRKAELERIRAIVHDAVPDVEEAQSYGMPAFKLKNRPLLAFTARPKHLSLYPFSPAVIDALRDQLADFELSKGTIHFDAEKPISESTLRSIIALRLAEIG